MSTLLLAKILDSSIWLEPLHTRIVWITLLAAMDEHGFCAFACPENVARRAGVSLEQANEALACLLAPDPNSSDPANEGRRVERVLGGFNVLNAAKYRVAARCGAVKSRPRSRLIPEVFPVADLASQAEAVYAAYPRKVGKPVAIQKITAAIRADGFEFVLERTKLFADARLGQDQQYTPHPATWFHQRRYQDDPETWKPAHKNGEVPIEGTWFMKDIEALKP